MRRRRTPVRITEESTFNGWQANAGLPEQNRPGASRQDHRLAADRAPLRNHAAHASRLALEPAHRAQWARMTAPMRCAARAMAGAAFWDSAHPSPGTCSAALTSLRTPHQMREIRAAQQARADLERARHLEAMPGNHARPVPVPQRT